MEETELKLELVHGDAFDERAACAIFGGLPEIITQRSTYFDTPDHALFGAGLSLRIRHTDDRHVQTIKARNGAAAGMFVRHEWECDVPGEVPQLDERTPVAALLGGRLGQLAPLFTVINRRSRWLVDGIEVALDRGHVAATDREAPFFEIELELKEGRVGALFALARRIDEIAPVRLAVLSKGERGYRLMEAASAARAEATDLCPAMTTSAAFRSIVQICIRQFRLNEALVLRARDPEALHQARASLRRLRSAIAAHKAMLDDDRIGALKDDLRWLAAALGQARDIDVLMQHVGNGAVAALLAEKRADAYAIAVDALESGRARRLMLALLEWTVDGAWMDRAAGRDLRMMPARDFARTALDRLARQFEKSGCGFEKLDDAGRHELRRRAKNLRYTTEFYAGLFGEKGARHRYRSFRAALERVQDRLGALNDLANAPRLLRALGLDWQIGDCGRKDRLIAEAAKACADFLGRKAFWH